MVGMFHPERDQMVIEDVLAALGQPVRLEAVRRLASGEEKFCGEVSQGVPKSTMTHHWRILREAGIIRQRPEGRKLFVSLRRDDLDARFPGLLDVVLGSRVGR